MRAHADDFAPFTGFMEQLQAQPTTERPVQEAPVPAGQTLQ